MSADERFPDFLDFLVFFAIFSQGERTRRLRFFKIGGEISSGYALDLGKNSQIAQNLQFLKNFDENLQNLLFVLLSFFILLFVLLSFYHVFSCISLKKINDF